MITQAEFDALLQRYLDGQSRPGEQQLVEKWSAQLGQQENLLLHPGLHAEVRAAMWHRIVHLTQDEAAAPPVVRRLVFWRAPAVRWAAAAGLVLSGGVGWLLQQSRHQPPVAAAPAIATKWVLRRTSRPQADTLLLADGSQVTLYTGSTLRYRPGLAGARREVYLAGQAFFKVAKNPARPFLVYTDKVVTTVLGTSFLVTAYAGRATKVAVREGRVAVQARQGAELSATPAHPAATGELLLPNQQAVYSPATQHITKALVEKPVMLTPQPLVFRKQPVAEVLTALEKAYGVNIVYDPLKLSECTITISLGDESLFEQLDVLCKALNASYKMANNAQIIFESSGCSKSPSY